MKFKFIDPLFPGIRGFHFEGLKHKKKEVVEILLIKIMKQIQVVAAVIISRQGNKNCLRISKGFWILLPSNFREKNN